MGLRYLTTAETAKLHGMQDIQGRIADEVAGLDEPLPTRKYVEPIVPEMIAAPTSDDLAKAMASLNTEVKSAVNTEATGPTEDTEVKLDDVVVTEPVALPVVNAEPLTAEEAGPDAILEPVTVVPTAPTAPSVAAVAPAPTAQVMTVPDEPTGPMIFVDTSAPAMQAEGLVDAPDALAPPPAAPRSSRRTTRRVILPPTN